MFHLRANQERNFKESSYCIQISLEKMTQVRWLDVINTSTDYILKNEDNQEKYMDDFDSFPL